MSAFSSTAMPQISSFPELTHSTLLGQKQEPEKPHGPPEWAKIKVGSWLVLETEVKKETRHYWSGSKCLPRRLPNSAHGPPDWAKVKSVPVLEPELEVKVALQQVGFVPVWKTEPPVQVNLVRKMWAQSLSGCSGSLLVSCETKLLSCDCRAGAGFGFHGAYSVRVCQERRHLGVRCDSSYED